MDDRSPPIIINGRNRMSSLNHLMANSDKARKRQNVRECASKLPVMAITIRDAAGIGPEITVKTFAEKSTATAIPLLLEKGVSSNE